MPVAPLRPLLSFRDSLTGSVHYTIIPSPQGTMTSTQQEQIPAQIQAQVIAPTFLLDKGKIPTHEALSMSLYVPLVKEEALKRAIKISRIQTRGLTHDPEASPSVPPQNNLE
ncbi:hypothetical protein HAX54_025097 [Datura stramonium]|uniref:Uncharacterized protein n=1 Tax=Datura stramonium TaxID=4076 RepID=A0ABS8V066_DATST|nr:hypothetical protein [Datura stramonium]